MFFVITVDLESSKHASEFILSANLSEFFAIACCGGDGVMHFALDALYQRKIDIPVFCIPAGHGVGIASSILASGSPTVAAFSIAKGFRRELDLIEVKQNGKVMCHGSLLVSWGMVADIEFDTHGLRWLGPIRYKVGAIASFVTKSSYHHLRVSYVPAKHQTMTFCTGEGCKTCLQGVKRARGENVVEEDEQSTTQTNHDHPDGRSDSVKNTKIEDYEWLHKRIKTIDDETDVEDNPDNLSDFVEDDDEDVWHVEEGYFLLLIALNLSDTTKNHRIAPYAHASDGCIDLVYIKEVSTLNCLQLFNTLKTGSFVDSNFYMDESLGYIKVTKFKVEALDEKRVVSVDGIPYVHNSVLEGTVIPSAATLGS